MPTTIPTTTSSTRPGSPSTGDAYFETDTNNYIIYDGANWRGYESDGASGWSGNNSYSLNFDGTNDYSTSTFNPSTLGTGDFSISLWFNADVTGVTHHIFYLGDSSANQDYANLSIRNTNILRFQMGQWSGGSADARAESTNTISSGTWYHVLCQREGTTIKIFVNNTEWASVTDSDANTANFGTSSFFGTFRNTTGWYDGKMDEVSIYDKVLSSSERTTLYSSGTPDNVMSLSPVAWYRMGDGIEAHSGTTVYDMSSSSNNMTLINGTAYSTSVPS
jgi:hypothetical protein